MKQFLLLLISVFAFNLARSQDTIVTTEGDTLDCKITRVTSEFIHFSVYDHTTGIILMRSRLPMSGVASYTLVEAPTIEEQTAPSPEDVTFEEKEEPYSPEKSAPIVRLAISSGYTQQFEGYDGLPTSYKRQVQSLWNIGGELIAFPGENFGIGIKYNRISTPAFETFNTFNGIITIDEEIQFTYFALSLMRRQIMADEDHTVYYHAAAGIVTYRDDGTIDGIPFFEEGDTFGLGLGVGYDYRIGDTMGIGLDVELNIANLNSVNVNGTVISGANFGISRIDITAGIRFFR